MADEPSAVEHAARLLAEGRAFEAQENYEAAAKRYRRAAEEDPTCHEAWWARYLVLLNKLDRLDDALDVCEAAAEAIPSEKARWYYWGAQALNGCGYYDDAVDVIDEALEYDDLLPYGWSSKATFLKNARRYEEAIAAADRALTIFPDDHVAMGMKALSLDMLGRSDEAKELRAREQEAFLRSPFSKRYKANLQMRSIDG